VVVRQRLRRSVVFPYLGRMTSTDQYRHSGLQKNIDRLAETFGRAVIGIHNVTYVRFSLCVAIYA